MLRKLPTSLDVVLRASKGDSLTAQVSAFAVDLAGEPSVWPGTTMTFASASVSL